MAAGYIYVLANSSMPGLVKVGRTSRSPSDRATELSGVTGVATPFLVVYEDYFENCEAVETYVHTALAQKGVRVSETREFFRAPVSDVVKAIASMPPSVSKRSSPSDLDGSIDAGDKSDTAPPWDDLMEEADKYYRGKDGYLQDYSEAFKLYTGAARLGCPEAYQNLGMIYQYGKGVDKSFDKALAYYKEGTKKGAYYCWLPMALVFVELAHFPNAWKSFFSFVTEGEECNWGHYGIQDHDVLMMLTFLKALYYPPKSWTIDPALFTVVSQYQFLLLDQVEKELKTQKDFEKRFRNLITALEEMPQTGPKLVKDRDGKIILRHH